MTKWRLGIKKYRVSTFNDDKAEIQKAWKEYLHNLMILPMLCIAYFMLYLFHFNLSLSLKLFTRSKLKHYCGENWFFKASLIFLKTLSRTRSFYLGIWSAISSRLSLGFIGVFSNSREGAVKWLRSARLTRRKTLAPLLWWSSAFLLFLFASSRWRLWRRKKNIDILHSMERKVPYC